MVAAAGVVLLLLLLPGLYALLRQEQVTAALTKKVNESVNTRISYGRLHITIFESFPNISVRFNDLLVAPSPSYDKSQFADESNDTLLYASRLSLTISTPSLLTGRPAVRSITGRDGMISLLTDKDGDINYRVFSETRGEGKGIRLKNISVSDFLVVYNDRKAGMRLAGSIQQATLGGEIFGTGIYLTTSLNSMIDSLSLNGTTVREIPLETVIRLRKSASSLSVTKGSMAVADLKFQVTGNVNYSHSTLNLNLEGKKISIASLVSHMPDRWRSMTGTFSPSGIVDVMCTLSGPYGEAGRPHIELTYGLSGGKMSHSVSGFRVNNLEFNGSLTNGSLNSAETFRLTMDNLTARYGSATVKGSFMINNLNRPHINLALEGDLNFNHLSKIFRSGYIEDQSGSLSGSLRLSGTLPEKQGLIAGLPWLRPEASLTFREFSASFAQKGVRLSEVNGAVTIREDLVADSLSFTLLGQRITFNGVMKNFIRWVAGTGAVLNLTGELHSDMIVTARLDSLIRKTSRGSSSSNPFPAEVKANMQIRADSFIYNNFRSSAFSSNVSYTPYVLNFTGATAEGLEGNLSGELMLGRQPGGGYISHSKLDVKNIDIKQAFTTFNNFGQDFIVSDNLQGRLTGNVNLLAPLDSSFRIIPESAAAEAHLLINEGRLVRFAPAESLSSYLDLDELKDISFSKMENDLYIKNSSVSIPKMLINSSAVNFTLYGTHNFDGNYLYHVRLLLSEVLSRKARERNREVSSYGNVKVDGSGKATVPLKIEGIEGKVTVSYDFGQAQDNIKTDIAIEKQTLKGILNEEYGWYQSDTARVTPAESKPRFIITWEEGKEQTPVREETQEEVRESPLRNLLKKRSRP